LIKMKDNKFLNNTSWLLSGQVLRLLISFFVGIITTRYLGPANYGIINYVGSYVSFFTTIVGLGFGGIMVYELINHKDHNSEILGTAIFFRFITGVLCAAAMMGIIYITDGNEQTVLMVAFVEAIQLPFQCFDTINYWYQSKMRSKSAVLVQVLAHFIASCYKVFLLVTGKTVIWFGFALTLEIILAAAGYLAMYSRENGPKLEVSASTAKRLLISCGPFIVANLMVVVYAQIDRIMIKQMLNSNSDVGLYSAAVTICQLFGFLPITLLEAMRPLVVEGKKQGEEQFNLRFRQLSAAILWSCIVFSVGVLIFSKLIIYILYGTEYLAASTCLKIVVWYTAFSYLGSARNLWLICENQSKKVMIFSGIGAVVNVIINYLLIPEWGINGAAFATLITQIFSNFIIPSVLPSTRPYAKCVIDALLLRDIKIKQAFGMICSKFRR